MEIEYEITNTPNTVKFYWKFFSDKLNMSPFEAGCSLSFFFTCAHCLVIDDPAKQMSIVTGDSVDEVISVALDFVKIHL